MGKNWVPQLNWMVNTKLDIHICGPTSVFHFDPHPFVWWLISGILMVVLVVPPILADKHPHCILMIDIPVPDLVWGSKSNAALEGNTFEITTRILSSGFKPAEIRLGQKWIIIPLAFKAIRFQNIYIYIYMCVCPPKFAYT